jgi:XTP/dITP diphosphohydrolase
MSSGPFCPLSSVPAPVKLYLASSNPGKLAEFRALAASAGLSAGMGLEQAPWFDSLPAFDENEPTFAENALGKALHCSMGHDGFVFADDSGLVVPALGGAPGVKSARYAGAAATSGERNAKLLAELRGRTGQERSAHFVCVIALAKQGRAVAIISDRVEGMILDAPRGELGFGYDPVFYFPDLDRSFAELSQAEKNTHSHRGKAFRRLLELIH